ncbi:MFS transporter [Brevibacillus fulvus]|uniref:MFS family permease n=1 Tax=Brevibacillus fulvus TaxID=1125967 RepID=A0A939BSY8_9BACL|nr:MFS transporter [Brevibacillus fulvus]MBM7591242.1 MFS family permease [Brevibacillus fulvus]
MLRQNRSFRNLFIAYALATLGSWFDFIAIAILLAYVWHADPLTIGLLPLMYAGPGLLFGQLSGIIADRCNKLTIMLLADWLRVLITLLMVVAPNVYWLLPLIFCRSVAAVFHTPAQQAMTRAVVSEAQLLKATTLNGMVFQTGKIFGPLIGSSLAAIASPKLCLLINAGCFLLSVCFLRKIKPFRLLPDSPQSSQPGESFVQAWTAGWAILFGNRQLFFSLLFSLIGIMAIQMVDAQFPVLFREQAPAYPQLVGWTVSAIGIGALSVVTWLNRWQQIRQYGWMFGAGMLLVGLLFAAFGHYQAGQSLIWLLLPALLGGVGTGLASVASNYLLQKESPKEAVGRMIGIFETMQSAVFVAAPVLGGLLIETIGASLSFRWIGYAIILIGLGGIVCQRLIWGTANRKKSPSTQADQASV